MKDDDDDIPEDESALWKDVMRDVKPISGRLKNAGGKTLPPKTGVKSGTKKKPDNIVYLRTLTPAAGSLHKPVSVPAAPDDAPLHQGIDKRTDERLRRGQMKIEAKLDLHGMRQAEARTALIAFIETSYAQGKRCVLVITGKGARTRKQDLGSPEYTGQEYNHESRPGILKENLPRWLREPRLQNMILQSYPAQGRHGGAGAFYILLRRSRD